MGNTPKGLPFPAETAYVKDGASAMHALADATDDALGGALFRATVAAETVANSTDDQLHLTLTVDDSPLFSNPDGNAITYTGPRAIALVTAQVTWEGNVAGTRRITITLNNNDQAVQRVAPDSQPITQSIAWPLILTSGDKLRLVAYQTSGGALGVTSAKFRCVILGVAP